MITKYSLLRSIVSKFLAKLSSEMYYFIAKEEENEQLRTNCSGWISCDQRVKLLVLFVSENFSTGSLEDIGGEIVVKSS